MVLRAPDVQDERTRELLRELAQVQTTDVRAGHLEQSAADGITEAKR